MKKNAVLYHVFGLFLCPIFLVCIFTIISSLATANFEYLPESLDFMNVFFNDIAGFVFDFSLFFLLGAFAFSLSEKRIFPSVFTGVAALFHGLLLPMLQFFFRSLILLSSAETEVIEAYWAYDVQSSIAGTLTVCLGLIICGATVAFFKLTKRESRFSRPYIAPFSVPAVAGIIISGGNILFSALSFALGREYGAAYIANLLTGIVVHCVFYFVIVLGAYCQKRFLTEKEILN